MSGLKLYKSYVFKDRDPIIDLMRTAVEDTGDSYAHLSVASGVSTTTLSNWFGRKAKTKRPQFCTLQAVARACGKELVLANVNGKGPVQHVKGLRSGIRDKS